MIKPFIIDYVVYPFNLAVFFGHTDDEVFSFLNKRLTKRLTDDDKAVLALHGRGRTVMLPTGQTVLRLGHIPKAGDPFLAHEIFHATSFLLNHIGMPLDHASEEAYAYLLMHITSEINKKLKTKQKQQFVAFP